MTGTIRPTKELADRFVFPKVIQLPRFFFFPKEHIAKFLRLENVIELSVIHRAIQRRRWINNVMIFRYHDGPIVWPTFVFR
jgi:hypothetical protein